MDQQDAILVTPDNFTRAESDAYFAKLAGDGSGPGFATFLHFRELAALDNQIVIRINRDTLYSAAVVDLDAAPVTITLPDAGDRFMSLQLIDEDHYVHDVVYGPGAHTYTREGVGTRYAVAAVRTLVNPADQDDLAVVHVLQDSIEIQQAAKGTFDIPHWDQTSQKKVRDALVTLADTLPDTHGMFGTRADTDPVRHLIGSASAWGGNPERDAFYLNVVPTGNDGVTPHRLTVGDVPVDGFWSVTVYNAEGYLTPNERGAYSVNNLTAAAAADGTVIIGFGDDTAPNVLPITPGWNYMVRLYRPHPEILSGEWIFPEATAL